MRTYSLLILFLAEFVLSSCSTGTSPDELSEMQGNWELQSLQLGGATVQIPNPESYTVRFNSDGSLDIRADCNGCFGSYETDGNSISIGTLGCTAAACLPGSLGTQYAAALSSASSFERSGAQLSITYAGGVMRFLVAP